MIIFWPSKMITFRVLSFMLSFGVIIYFMLSFNFIIFDVIIWCYHLLLSLSVIIYLMLLFYVIISHSWQMLSFLCYHFSLYSISVIFYVIIWWYHFLLSFPPFFLFPKNVTHSFVPQVYRAPQIKHMGGVAAGADTTNLYVIVDIVKESAWALGWFFPHDRMHVRKWQLPFCVSLV
jgi:hypothetical protein